MTVQTESVTARLIFTAAMKLTDESARMEYLASVCGNHPALRKQLEALLAASDEVHDNPLRRATEQFATSPQCTPDQDPATTERSRVESPEKGVPFPELPLDVSSQPDIGPYRIRELIGEGGMGYVYVAEQTEPIRRYVALKVIKPGMDTSEVIARFEAERQALAMMDHPNIARILDGGTMDGGRPYFVMELVRGVPITEFCHAKKLRLRSRLELFIDICKAVQHAHHKGIIHRDLKPSNIMITLCDGKPVVKVIDFGVAKAVNQALTRRTVYTQYSHMIGTPLYMAPEQAEMSCLDIDTRSDIYSLGVILYELLTGTTPFDRRTMSRMGFDGICKLIREQNPERPSVRISTIRAGHQVTIEDQRMIDSDDISRQLRGELDWVVMKALEKDRERRYETANAFAEDIQRYLSNEPVEACPPTLSYRLKKYAGKHKGLLTTVSLLVAMLVTATAAIAAFAFQANAAKTEAVEARELADKRLAQSRVDFDRALKSLDLVVQQLSSAEFAQIPGVAKTRANMLQQMLTMYEEIASEHDNDPYVKQQQGIAYRRISEILWLTGQYEEGEQAVSQGIVILEELLRAEPKNESYNAALASLHFHRLHLWTRSNADRLADAERALLLWRGLVDGGHVEHAELLGLIHLKVANLLPDDSLEVDRHIKESIRIPESYGLTPHWTSYLELATLAERNRDWEAAEKNYRRCIELSRESAENGHRIDRGLHAENCSEFAQLLNTQGRSSEARRFHLEAVDVARRLYEEYGRIPAYERLLNERVRAYLTDAADEQQKEDVLKLLDQIVTTWPDAYSFHSTRAQHLAERDDAVAILSSAIERFPDQSAYYRHRGKLLRDRGEQESALADLEKALELTDEDSVPLLKMKVAILHDLSRSKEAVKIMEEAIQRKQEQNENTRQLHQEYAWILYRSEGDRVGQLSAAIEKYPTAAPYYYYRGVVQHGRREWETAIVDLEQAIKYDRPDSSDWYHHYLEDSRAEVCRREEDYENALRHYDNALSHRESETVRRGRARVLFQLGRFDQVLADIAGALERATDADNALWWIPVSDVADCPDQGFKDGIVAIADQAVETNDTAYLRVARGNLLAALKYDDRAQQDFEKALELAPDKEYSYSFYLTFLIQRERWQEASELVERQKTIQPGAHYPQYQVALLLLSAGDPVEYRRQCLQTLTAFTDSDIPLESHFAAWTCALAPAAIDDYEPAIQLARRAVEQEPENSQYLNGLGAILMRAGQYADARQSLEKALAAERKDSTSRGYTRYILAITEHHLGNAVSAREQLRVANAVAEKELAGNPVWNRRLTLELLRKEAETLITPGQDANGEQPVRPREL